MILELDGQEMVLQHVLDETMTTTIRLRIKGAIGMELFAEVMLRCEENKVEIIQASDSNGVLLMRAREYEKKRGQGRVSRTHPALEETGSTGQEEADQS